LPTKRHYRLRGRREEFGGGKLLQLKTGRDFFADGYGRRDPDREAMREDWRLHGAGIVRDWIGEHPCSRPWGFYQFESLPGDPKQAGRGFVRVNGQVVSEREYLRDAGLLTVDELRIVEEK